MPKPLIRRVCLIVLTALAVSAVALVLPRAGYWICARQMVSYALSGEPGSSVAAQGISRLGERAVPLVFDEMRTGTDPDRFHLGVMALSRMADERRLDPSAAYARRLLADPSESTDIRYAAAQVLGSLWYSAEAEQALRDQVRQERSASVKGQCISSLNLVTVNRGHCTGKWQVDPRTVELYVSCAGDKDRQRLPDQA